MYPTANTDSHLGTSSGSGGLHHILSPSAPAAAPIIAHVSSSSVSKGGNQGVARWWVGEGVKEGIMEWLDGGWVRE